MRRLFTTFASGVPGLGLLLLRLTVGITLIYQGVIALGLDPPLGSMVFYSFLMLLGVLIVVGLWTPIVGVLGGLGSFWYAHTHLASWAPSVRIGIMAVALALLGPGTWSFDAWLYGWKQIKISDGKRRQDANGSDSTPKYPEE